MSAFKDPASLKKALASSGLEDQFLQVTGLSSLDELSSANFEDMRSRASQLETKLSVPPAGPIPFKDMPKEKVDSKSSASYDEASDFLQSFKHLTIRYPPAKKVNVFVPNAVIMFLIVHQINNILADKFYFLRTSPDYHPILVRIYFGVLFVVQTLRAMHAANILTGQNQYDFLMRFLDAFPPETLSIPAPLLHVFKSLCASRPEIDQLGFVCPFLPTAFYDDRLSAGNFKDHIHMIPDIPGMLSLLSLLKTEKIYGKSKQPDIKGKSFRGLSFDADVAQWSSDAAWSLLFPGINHGQETGKKVNELFFDDRYDDLSLPSVSSNSQLNTPASFCYLTGNMSWFSTVRDIATTVAVMFPGSGTLADCSPIGIPTGQIVTQLLEPDSLPTIPTGLNEKSSIDLDTRYRLITSARSIPQLAVIVAGASQINKSMYSTHPKYPGINSVDLASGLYSQGKFWDIRPLESSAIEEDAFFGLADSIKKGVKDKP
nr:MAG: coat protein [Flammulina alphapartitivirus 1]